MKKAQYANNYIKDFIKNNEPGTKLPSEIAIATELGISRNIVRNTLYFYQEKGLIVTKHGSGSYIAKHRKTDKYIIISCDKERVLGLLGYAHRLIINKIEEILKTTEYQPYIYLIDDVNKFKLPFMPDKIAGYISLTENKFKLSLLEDNNIPIVSVGDLISYNYPAIIMNYQKHFFLIQELIKKYDFKQPIIFNLAVHLKESSPYTFISYGINRFFEEKYYFRSVQPNAEMKSSLDVVSRAFGNLNFKPDLFIFIDDTIYKGAISYINNNEILKKTKIITHSNEDISFGDNVCRITFDLDQVARESVNLINSIINREHIERPIIPISPYIINEEALKQ